MHIGVLRHSRFLNIVYEQHELGGSMVRKAYDCITKQDVAIKKVLCSNITMPGEAMRLYRELYLLRQLDHPNVLKLNFCYRSGEDVDADIYRVVTSCWFSYIPTKNIKILDNHLSVLGFEVSQSLRATAYSHVVRRGQILHY